MKKKIGNLLKKNSTGSVHCIFKKYFLNDIVLKLEKIFQKIGNLIIKIITSNNDVDYEY